MNAGGDVMGRNLVDVVAWPLALRLRQHVAAELAAAVAGGPGVVSVVPGRDVALDDCCDGQAWVRVVRIFRTSVSGFPQPSTVPHDADRCGVDGQWAVELGVGVVRCVPGLDGRGQPPTATELEKSASGVLDDAARIRAAVLCRFTDDVDSMVVGEWLPVGPEGGCVGGELAVTAAVDHCGCGSEAG